MSCDRRRSGHRRVARRAALPRTPFPPTSALRHGAEPAARSYPGDMYARRRHVYFAMMGVCVGLFVLAWGVVRIWSVPAAVGMCIVAMVIPPVAAMIANRRGPEDRWWDDPSGDPESDEWWDELDGKKRPRR
ncbi:DUF3099 domain-containing protein [Streptomyces misionensis]|uniref:DUF3099 domain-containing protein n=1 Tax=Streptomyces misionensis TaxID=67331 RepID=UPI00381EEF06